MGREHIGEFTLGGPLVIPKVVNGRGKVFFFANYAMSNDSAPGRLAATSHRAGQPEAPRGRFLRLAAVALGRRGQHASGPPSVPDLRPVDDAARSGSAGTRHSHAVPREHHSTGPVHERGRDLQEPDVRALSGDGAGAEPELPLADAAAGQQLLPRGGTRPAAQHPVQHARGLQPLRELPLFLPRQRQQIRRVVAGRLDVRLARSAVPGPARRVAGAVQLVGDRHVDEDARRAHRHRHADFRQPRPSARHAQEHGQLPAIVGRAAVVPGRLLPGAIRMHPAAEQPELV